MKAFRKATVILLFALLVSTFTTGCAGCGNDTTQNTEDMVESTPNNNDTGIMDNNTGIPDTQEQPLPSKDATDNNGGNETANDISGNTTVNENGDYVDENGNRVDENGNIIDDAGNIINDAGNAVGDVLDNVGDAARDVVDGVGNGVRSLTQ